MSPKALSWHKWKGLRPKVRDELRKSEARYQAVVDSAFDAIITITPDAIVRSFNRAAERIFGYRAEEVIGGPVTLLMPERYRDLCAAGLQRYLETGEARVIGGTTELEGLRKDGSEFPIELSLGEMHEGEDRLFTSVIRDISERKHLEEQLQRQAFHDALTGLPNRALFLDRLTHALARAERQGSETAILFADLDNFKVINDSLGHKVGDQLLIAVAERLKACLRPGDTAARLGGDEFTVLCEEIASVSDAARIAERIAEKLRSPFALDGHEVVATLSIGIAISSSAQQRPVDLLRQADTAMYRAKAAGRPGFEVFEPSMHTEALERLEVETELRRAIEREEFRVYYQPEVLLKNGEIVGMEALVRWEHPERGLLLPKEFLSIADQSGLIIPIGRWVLREACNQVRVWQEKYSRIPPLTMSVNLSARQFLQPELVAEVLRETGVDPLTLQLEITEGTVMSDNNTQPFANDTLQWLKSLGVKLAIDDFGMGYSSLSYLKRFPIDFLKIDRSFVGGLVEDHTDTKIVSAIIHLARALDLKVIAEGVETAEQLERLREMGCDMAQGHYFSVPLPSEAVPALLQKQSL